MESNHGQLLDSHIHDQQQRQSTNLDLIIALASSLAPELKYGQSFSNNNISDRNRLQDVCANVPNHITKEPAVFIAKKLFSDFSQLVNKKIETILAQEQKDRSIFESLQQNEDVAYDQVLEALGAVSEYCLPYLLKVLVSWYHQQINVEQDIQKQRQPKSLGCAELQRHHHNKHRPSSDCGSFCNDTQNSISSLIRSPTPSCPETTTCSINNLSIASTLPLDYQHPSSLTVTGSTAELISSRNNTLNSTYNNVNSSSISLIEESTSALKQTEIIKTRKLIIEFALCQALLEVFNRLYLHPGYDDLIGQIEDIAFEHFRYVEGDESNPDVAHLTDKFAELIGVLARCRFKSVRKRFMTELNELRSKEPTPFNMQCIATLLSGMKFFRVKMAPIEEFEASLQFLQECAEYFLEVKHKSIKHALAGILADSNIVLKTCLPTDLRDWQMFNNNNVMDKNRQYISENLPNHITKDNPKPAVFIARKLFSDFSQMVNKKIETILAQEQKDKPIFKSLQQNEDAAYDQILEALGAVSEYCLPSLLKILVAWYNHQVSIDEDIQKMKQPQSLELSEQQNNEQHPLSDCGSPCNDTPTSNSSLIRSPTPSCPETTSSIISSNINNQTLSIASTLPLDYQHPSSLTVIGTTAELHSSAANTSNSTVTNISSNSLTEDSTSTIKRLEIIKTRKLLIEFALCQALVEVFNQLYLHPGHDDLIGQIEDIAFEHFRYVEGNESNPDVAHLADKFAEVIGVLARCRFKSVRKRFMTELNELRSKEPTPFNMQCIATLLSGMKFFRVKMAPIEEFEASLQFLQECAEYFLEVRHKSIKHALAGLFVEVLLPLASTVKNEVKIPCLKNFVDTLWNQTLDMCARKKYSITLFPLVTCLLCVSHRSFFLANWPIFLNMCLSNLKNRDQKMCRIALESLYRLIWIYMIRVKCESNNVTQARLQSIVDALFPKGSRTVVPRDSPLVIFVHIIQFIAQERLDFAMRHIVFDLLSVDRPFKVISSPERMNIGLQAFLLIADSLQQKEGDTLMPKLVGVKSMSSGCAPIRRRSHVNKMLNDDTAKSIGIFPYYNHIQKSFNDILRALDAQYGRPLLLTTTHNTNKEPDEMITSERKPKIELFKTCVAAIPRLMPDGMPRVDLVDLLSRMTVHVDGEMRQLALESLQIFITDFPDWRLDTVEGFTSFLVNQIDESCRNLVDDGLKTLLQLMISWKSTITPHSSSFSEQNRAGSIVKIQTGYETVSSRHSSNGGQIQARKNRAIAEMRLVQSELSNTRFDRLVNVIQKVEGASLVMLGSCHNSTRKLASQLLREARVILKCYASWTCMEQFGFKSPDDCDEEDQPNQSIFCANKADNCFPFHVIVLLTHLLSNYNDPTSYSLNIARHIAIWCDENSQKLDNLSTVMTLYSRRCFSKDGFQWLKCVIKYLYDPYPSQLPTVIPQVVDMLEASPSTIQTLIAPILYCILNYVDISSIPNESINNDLNRIYTKYLGGGQWQEALQIFKLIIARSSQLASNGATYSRELPGRTMDFSFEVESIPL